LAVVEPVALPGLVLVQAAGVRHQLTAAARALALDVVPVAHRIGDAARLVAVAAVAAQLALGCGVGAEPRAPRSIEARALGLELRAGAQLVALAVDVVPHALARSVQRVVASGLGGVDVAGLAALAHAAHLQGDSALQALSGEVPHVQRDHTASGDCPSSTGTDVALLLCGERRPQ